MGGDTGGNDCVHVLDLRAHRTRCDTANSCVHVLDLRAPRETVASLGRVVSGPMLRPDTDVVIYDEHGNVCQFTYQEWDAFALKMKRDEFDHIGLDVTLPERRCPDDRKHGAHVWEWGNDSAGRTNYRCGGWRKLPDATGNIVPAKGSYGTTLDALIESGEAKIVSAPGEPLKWAQNATGVSGTIAGAVSLFTGMSRAELDELGGFALHTAEATGTPEHLRAVADELERRDALPPTVTYWREDVAE